MFKYTGNIYKNEIKIENELEWIHKVTSNSKDYRCAILADGVYVGNIYLTDIENGSAEYHIFIGDKLYWGKGVAKQASILILEYAFNVLSLDSVKLQVRKENTSALMLYQRLGFEVEKENVEWISMIVMK